MNRRKPGGNIGKTVPEVGTKREMKGGRVNETDLYFPSFFGR